MSMPRDFWVKSLAFTKRSHQDVYPAIDPSRPELNLGGKVVIITGASRGVGSDGFIPAFVKAGVKGIVLMATNEEKLATKQKEISTSAPQIETLKVAVNISDAASVDSAFSQIAAKFGHADILINAAGVMAGDGPPLHETDLEIWWSNWEVNAKGPYLMIRSFLRQLPNPTKTRATIVNVSSLQGPACTPGAGGYFMSKFAADALAQYVGTGYPEVTCVAVHPGLVLTDMLREPLRSNIDTDSPALVGGVAVWLCAEERARFLSGRFLNANWGVEDLLELKDEIVEKKSLHLTIKGEFGVSTPWGLMSLLATCVRRRGNCAKLF